VRPARTIISVIILSLLSYAIGSFDAFAQPPALGFPAADPATLTPFNPYTAPIITVLDHSATTFYDKNHTWVEAYTGELANGQPGPSCKNPLTDPCGYYNPNFVPNDDTNTLQFIANGTYSGYSGDCPNPQVDCLEKYKVLNYRGHSGYDYGYTPETAVIVAPADGTLYVPASDPINGHPGGSDPWCAWHTFYIDHGNGWTTWYLHADHLTVNGRYNPNCASDPAISSDVKIGQVHRGDQVAVVGNFADGYPGGVGYHLHFEVRRGCYFQEGQIQGCQAVDPYGWEWIGGDPIANNSMAAVRTEPLWDLASLGVHLPVVNSAVLSGSTATITGSNFEPGALVTLWNREGQYFVPPPITPDSSPAPTSTQIVAELPSATVANPGDFVLKVKNPHGPRSRGIALSVATGSSSVPLVLDGQPAPGGGTFVSFGGFYSMTDQGTASFEAGVDANGDGMPDYYSDFQLLAGSSKTITAPGFSTISSSSTHVRINNNGDMALDDINGTFGGEPAIYLVKSGSSTPNKIIGEGDACPSPCPIGGSPTIYDLKGPLAINDADDVTFSTSLRDSSGRFATCCYLYEYSASGGSILKVASDGLNGDPTPVGGTFVAGELDDGINQITSDGEVLFFAHVDAGSSPGAIFRFSQTGGLSKVVAQGDPVPGGGTFGFPLMGWVGAVSGRQLVFHAPVLGASTNQVIAVKKDVTVSSLSDLTIVAYQGESTGTPAGGNFSDPNAGSGPNLPFGYFGQNSAPPVIRSDGAVVFHSLLTGAAAQDGSPTDAGIFLWNGRSLQKVIVDGDRDSAGQVVSGVFQPVMNDLGKVLYFVASTH
jgi:hypothetical protein